MDSVEVSVNGGDIVEDGVVAVLDVGLQGAGQETDLDGLHQAADLVPFGISAVFAEVVPSVAALDSGGGCDELVLGDGVDLGDNLGLSHGVFPFRPVACRVVS